MPRTRLIDISPEISENSAVFPGDMPFSREVSAAFSKGDHLELSGIRMTVHVGAHADAPSHFHAEGAPIDRRPLDLYLGPCQVVAVKAAPGARIAPADVKPKIRAERVLFKTNSANPYRWSDDFNSFSPELIDWLAKKKVVLVGIDTPSADPRHSKALESHQALYRNDMAVLEGLDLSAAPEGLYELIALPLRIKDSDAAPVRAVLVKR
jgi:arylformamidase